MSEELPEIHSNSEGFDSREQAVRYLDEKRHPTSLLPRRTAQRIAVAFDFLLENKDGELMNPENIDSEHATEGSRIIPFGELCYAVANHVDGCNPVDSDADEFNERQKELHEENVAVLKDAIGVDKESVSSED